MSRPLNLTTIMGVALCALLSSGTGAAASSPPAKAPEAAATSQGVELGERFLGSSLRWTTVATTQSFDPSVAQTYNPYVGMAGRFRIQYWPLRSKLFIAAEFGLRREFTRSDSTTEAQETRVTDLALSVASPSVVRVPIVGVDLGMSLRLDGGLSKASRFKSQRLAITPGITLRKRFEAVLSGLSLGYSFAVSAYVHEYTTSSNALDGRNRCGPGVGIQELVVSSCLNTGVRNAQVRVVNGLSLSLDVIDELGFSIGAAFVHDFLYPQGAKASQGVTYEPTPGRDIRHYMSYSAEVYAKPWPPLTLAVGVQDFNSVFHSDPQQTYRLPFDPFSTELYLDVRVDVARLVLEAIAP